MKTLIVGNPVVTLGEPALIPHGAIVAQDREIVAAGPRAEMESYGPFDDIIGSDDHVVMPGFINSHYHSGGPLFPGLIEYIFERANVHIGRSLQPEDADLLRLGVLVGLMGCVRGGQTSALDFSYGQAAMPAFGWDTVIEAYYELGLRTAFGPVTRDQNIYAHEPNEEFLLRLPEAVRAEVTASPMGYAWPVDEVLAVFERQAKEWHGRDDLMHVILTPDWTPACSDDLYRRCRDLANEYDTVISTHVLETRSEMVWNLKTHGVPAMRHLEQIGLLGPDVSVAHFVWASDEDIAVLADTGTIAVNNPGSNLRLSTGISRVRDIMARGGRQAFGTDSISFSESEDAFAELRLAAYLQRTPHALYEGRVDSLEFLRAMGDNGGAAIGWPGRVGRLTPGYLADVVTLKRDRIFWPAPKFDATPILDVLLDRAQAVDVEDVIINGKAVLRHGRFTTVDEDAIRAELEAKIERAFVGTEESRRLGELGAMADAVLGDIYTPWYELPVEPASVYNTRTPPSVP
jgi:5-methylthioadenosine/S-adenosylhomocysteine deaminase